MNDEPQPKQSLGSRLAGAARKPGAKLGGAGFGGLAVGLALGATVLGGGGTGVATAPDDTPVVSTLPPLGDALGAAGDEQPEDAPGDDGTDGEGDEGSSEPVGDAVDRNPLSGEPLDAPVRQRVIAAKVDNVDAAFPQVGLNSADMIIEVPVEGGMTRFTALYFSAEPLLVGPIRSIRPVDADLLAPLTPLLLTSGGQDFVERPFFASDVAIIDTEADGVYRPLNRPEPHHIFAVGEAVSRFAANVTTESGLFTFGEFAGTADAVSVTIPFSGVTNVEWSFADGVWARTQNGVAVEVLEDIGGAPAPLVTDTIVIIKVAERNAGYNDSAGAEVPTFDVVGFGDAMVLHDGQVTEGRWLRSAQEDSYVLVDASGQAMELPVGRVFLEVVPRYVDVELG